MERTDFDRQPELIAKWAMMTAVLMGLAGMGVGAIVVAALLWLGWHRDFTNWANSLQYWLEDDMLRTRGEFKIGPITLFRVEKSIPLARITDLKLVQGPVLSYLGIWQLRVQTAGQGSMYAEAILHGLVDPHGVRDAIAQRTKQIAP